jgi:hypothetical protein
MTDKSGIGTEHKTENRIDANYKKSLVYNIFISYIRNIKVKPQQIGNEKNKEYGQSVQKEYYPSGHRMFVEEVQCFPPKK